jgi:hypothetical protein
MYAPDVYITNRYNPDQVTTMTTTERFRIHDRPTLSNFCRRGAPQCGFVITVGRPSTPSGESVSDSDRRDKGRELLGMVSVWVANTWLMLSHG